MRQPDCSTTPSASATSSRSSTPMKRQRFPPQTGSCAKSTRRLPPPRKLRLPRRRRRPRRRATRPPYRPSTRTASGIRPVCTAPRLARTLSLRHVGEMMAAPQARLRVPRSRRRIPVLSGKNPLLIALALGLMAFLIAWSAMKAKEKRVKDKWQTVNILCAKVDIPEGTELDADMIAVKEMPTQFVTESFIKVDEDGSLKQDSPVGQRVMVPLKAGDPILVSHFESAREADFSTMINPKGRAVTIDVQEKSAVGLWVRPNDHVDVIGSFRDNESQQTKTVTLLQNVAVLATGRITANTTYVPDEDKKFQTVTLLVLPEEAEILTLAQELGSLTLLLRNPDDLDYEEKRRAADQKTLMTGERAGELQQKRYKTIQIIRGNKSTTNESTGVAAKSE